MVRFFFRLMLIGIVLLNLFSPFESAITAAQASRASVPSADTPIWRIGGSTEAVAVDDSYAYLAHGTHLRVVDLSTGNIVSSLPFVDQVKDVALSDVPDQDYAYVVTGSGGDLHIIDIVDPVDPTDVGVGYTSNAISLVVRWPYVFVVSNFSLDLQIFDVTDPASVVKTTYALPMYPKRLALSDDPAVDLLYILGENAGTGYLGILDISDPDAPLPVNTPWVSFSGGAENFTVAGNCVYITGTVGGFSPGVRIINVTVPASPVQVATWDYTYTGSTLGVAAMGNYLYVGFNGNSFTSTGMIHILDISNPSVPFRTAYVSDIGSYHQLIRKGEMLYVAGGNDGDFRRYDLDNPTSPLLTMHLNQPGYVEQVEVAGSQVFIRARQDHYGIYSGLWVYALDDPEAPELEAVDNDLISIYDFQVSGSYVYLTGMSHLVIKNKATLSTVGSYSHSEGVMNNLAVQGNVAYVLVGYQDLYVFNVSDRAHPAFVKKTTVDAVGNLTDITSAGDRIYIVKQNDKFYMYDITAPLDPVKTADYALPGINTLLEDNGYTYVGTESISVDTDNGLDILDVGTMGLVSDYDTINSTEGVDVIADKVFISGVNFARVLDVSALPVLSLIYTTSGPMIGADIAGYRNYFMTADHELGLTCFRWTAAYTEPPVITSISPTLKQAGSAGFTLTVNGAQFTNSSKVSWNGSVLPTTYVSSTKLTASVDSAKLSTTTIAEITVDGSDPALFTVYSFADVLPTHPLWRYVEGFFAKGITTGCAVNPLRYCPDRGVTRAEMAVFILRAKDGLATPVPNPENVGIFADVPTTGKEWMKPWIEEFYGQGITTGCAVNPLKFCPERGITRAEMAVFLLRALNDPGTPTPSPAYMNTFVDVPTPGKEWMKPWIEYFYEKGYTTGCGGTPGVDLRYCPERGANRAEMATFIDRIFGFGQLP